MVAGPMLRSHYIRHVASNRIYIRRPSTHTHAYVRMCVYFLQVFRKAAASAITLGSGASLGPEAPSVELGANTAAVLAPKSLSKRKQRMLIAAGAAAGVSAAFDAPVSGALFAVEFVLKSSRLGLDRLSTSTVFVATSVSAGTVGFLRAKGQALGIAGGRMHESMQIKRRYSQCT